MKSSTENIDFKDTFWEDKIPLIDSRKLVFPKKSIFFAIKGTKVDGHQFIASLYQKGVRHFVVNQVDQAAYPKAKFIGCNAVVEVLQEYAQAHRQKFDIPTIAITGSNGKTIIKEWLFQLLQRDYTIIKSPKSYNSQIGVPLSVLAMNAKHDLAIFEAGISQLGEMQRLQKMIQPTLGIFTNIGKAHALGFEKQTDKIKEKLRLFADCQTLIYCYEHRAVARLIEQSFAPAVACSWGASEAATIPIFIQKKLANTSLVQIYFKNKKQLLQLPFSDAASIENCLHGVVLLLLLGQNIAQIEQRLLGLSKLPMRLRLKEGIHNCNIIDDSYNNDLEGLKIALDFQNQKHKDSPQYRKTLILSDILESKQANLYKEIAELVQQHSIQKIIAIGEQLMQHKILFAGVKEQHWFTKTNDFVNQIDQSITFYQETILLKGARAFGFERIAQQLKKRIHSTVLEISLTALVHNLQCYQKRLQPTTKMMVMVKASAYGSGSFEVAQLLEYHQVDYLGVAYVDEAISLRNKGIHLPIMVMNTVVDEFELLCKYQLEPVLYSFEILAAFRQYLNYNQLKNYPVHLELDTGMRRLGFVVNTVSQLIEQLRLSSTHIEIKSIFSHLATADEPQQKSYVVQQVELFQKTVKKIEKTLKISPIKHILNSAGIVAYPAYQMDMVRLGIGLYGIDPLQKIDNLQNVAQLKTSISQIKTIEKGQTIGYSRKGKLPTKGKIAVLAIGYADGFLRALGNGNFKVKIRGQLVPTIGNICMDMCFVELRNLPLLKAGEEVIIFDDNASIRAMARALNTIPYEVLTNINDRVPRLFYED